MKFSRTLFHPKMPIYSLDGVYWSFDEIVATPVFVAYVAPNCGFCCYKVPYVCSTFNTCTDEAILICEPQALKMHVFGHATWCHLVPVVFETANNHQLKKKKCTSCASGSSKELCTMWISASKWFEVRWCGVMRATDFKAIPDGCERKGQRSWIERMVVLLVFHPFCCPFSFYFLGGVEFLDESEVCCRVLAVQPNKFVLRWCCLIV